MNVDEIAYQIITATDTNLEMAIAHLFKAVNSFVGWTPTGGVSLVYNANDDVYVATQAMTKTKHLQGYFIEREQAIQPVQPKAKAKAVRVVEPVMEPGDKLNLKVAQVVGWPDDYNEFPYEGDIHVPEFSELQSLTLGLFNWLEKTNPWHKNIWLGRFYGIGQPAVFVGQQNFGGNQNKDNFGTSWFTADAVFVGESYAHALACAVVAAGE